MNDINANIRIFILLVFAAVAGLCLPSLRGYANENAKPTPPSAASSVAGETTLAAAPLPPEIAMEADIGGASIFARAWNGGIVVFLTLTILVFFSILSWALIAAKALHLSRMAKTSEVFVSKFWDSRSLNDLNGRLNEYPDSPVKEVFRSGYSELVRGSQLRDNASNVAAGVRAAMDNLERTLTKTRITERKRLERFLPILATIAAAAPFIGLFGTVWGIMGAFEGIAQSGSASLAAVAPGISEALIATAFGLAAAIPAVMGYNLANARIRHQMVAIDGFIADFMNIVERYLVNDKNKSQSSNEPL